MSVLACLQSSVQVPKLRNQAENKFLKAARRVAGLSILARIAHMDLSKEMRLDLASWFASSLRDNKNFFTHYLDGIQGCGSYLENQASQKFFEIIKEFTASLTLSEDKEEVSCLLNALRWKFSARDHQHLAQLQLFSKLRSLNKPESLLCKSWGQQLPQKVQRPESEQCIQKEVVDYFESLFLLVVGRIIKPDVAD